MIQMNLFIFSSCEQPSFSWELPFSWQLSWLSSLCASLPLSTLLGFINIMFLLLFTTTIKIINTLSNKYNSLLSTFSKNYFLVIFLGSLKKIILMNCINAGHQENKYCFLSRVLDPPSIFVP